jgi:hypothetical protein
MVRSGVCLAAAVLALAGSAAAQDDPIFAYSRDPSNLVASLTEWPGELAMEEGGPSVRVFGDGRVEVSYPASMKRSGRYRARLDRTELDALVGSLCRKGVVEFDAAAARSARRAAAAGRTELRASTDPATTLIELYLERYAPPAGRGPERRGVARQIRWSGLRQDAEHYPEVAALRDLDAARRELGRLMQRDDLERVE